MEETLPVLDEAEVPAVTIYSVAGTANNEHYQTRDVLPETEMEGVGKVKMPDLSPKNRMCPVLHVDDVRVQGALPLAQLILGDLLGALTNSS